MSKIKKSNYRYSQEWRDSLRFIDITYSDFIDLLLNSNNKLFFSEKIDGELNSLIYEKGRHPYFITKGGIIRDRNYPVLDEYKKILDSLNINNCVIIGELKAVNDNGTFIQFNKSQSIIQTGDVNKVHHFIYDIYKWNNKKIKIYFPELQKICKNAKYIHVPKWELGSVNEFKSLWKDIVETRKGEGIVSFSPKNYRKLYRIKNVLTADVVVIGAGKINSKAWNKGHIGYLKVALLNKNNDFLLTSNVGTGFNNKIKIELFDYFNKKYVMNINNELLIEPSLIIEIKYRRHRFVKVPLLHYANNTYIKINEGNGVMLDHSSFIRFRDDKRIDYKDLSIKQFPL